MAVVGLVLVASGVGLYSSTCIPISGNPFEWAATIERWGYYPGGAPWLAPFRLVRMLAVHPYVPGGERMAPYDTLNGIAALAFAASVPFVWRRFERHMAC
jgi:hypothetical protein